MLILNLIFFGIKNLSNYREWDGGVQNKELQCVATDYFIKTRSYVVDIIHLPWWSEQTPQW